MIFLERLVLIVCNSFLFILVLKVGRNSWKLFHFVMMRWTTLYELHLKIFSLPARRLVPMFSEQQGKKEFWQSTSQPHPQELIKCLRTCGIKKNILDSCSFSLDWFKGNHDSTEELSCVRWSENFYLPFVGNRINFINPSNFFVNKCIAFTLWSQDIYWATYFQQQGEREWHLGVREREREWIIPFPKFGNGKGIEKPIPSIREWEGNEKNIPKIR